LRNLSEIDSARGLGWDSEIYRARECEESERKRGGDGERRDGM